MMPRVVRSPVCTVLTPWPITTRFGRSLPGHGPVARREDRRLAAAGAGDDGASLGARSLLHEDVLAAREVLAGLAEHDRDLERERDVAETSWCRQL
jgi:hypothetical protein